MKRQGPIYSHLCPAAVLLGRDAAVTKSIARCAVRHPRPRPHRHLFQRAVLDLDRHRTQGLDRRQSGRCSLPARLLALVGPGRLQGGRADSHFVRGPALRERHRRRRLEGLDPWSTRAPRPR